MGYRFTKSFSFFIFIFIFIFCQMKHIKNTVIFTGASKMLHSNLEIHLIKGCLMLRGKTFGGWAHFSYFDKRFGEWLRQTTDPLTKKPIPTLPQEKICRYTARLASRAWAKRSLYDAEDCKFPISINLTVLPLAKHKQVSTWSWVLPPSVGHVWSRFSSRAPKLRHEPSVPARDHRSPACAAVIMVSLVIWCRTP